MSSAQQRNISLYGDTSYVNALKKGLGLEVRESNDDNKYDRDNSDRDNSSSNSDDEIQTRSKTTRKTARRNERVARKQQQQQHAVTKQHIVAPSKQESAASPTIVETKQKKLTKRQQVLQRHADEEAAGAASVLASIADAAITRSHVRNQNTVMWTEKDRAAASRAADIAAEVAAEAAQAAQGKKKKEQPTPYWTRLHEKNRSNVRFQKEMGRVFECDFY
jgi:hypothetical protein